MRSAQLNFLACAGEVAEAPAQTPGHRGLGAKVRGRGDDDDSGRNGKGSTSMAVKMVTDATVSPWLC